MLNRPFLTELDSREAVKGSVDPLGIQPVWVHFGREVVGNLTTVSTSARDFTILLVGYWLAQRVVDQVGGSEVEAFLKWEQLASYVRARELKEDGFRGVTRVRKRLAEGSVVTLSADQAEQTLANQRLYGVFGLYSQPARSSGWVQRERVALTPAALELVERSMWPVFDKEAGREGRELLRWLRADSKRVDLDKHPRLLGAVAKLLAVGRRAAVRQAYREHLLFGGPDDTTAGRQRAFAQLLDPLYGQKDFVLDRDSLGALLKPAEKQFPQSDLAQRLHDVWVCESLMAPAIALFAHILMLDGCTVDEVAQGVHDAWGASLPSVRVEAMQELSRRMPPAYGQDGPPRFVQIAQCLGSGDYVQAVRLLMQQNAQVMRARGGSHWVHEHRGKLRVSLRYDSGSLPAKDAVPALWRHAYFLDSVRLMGQQVGLA